MLNNVVVVENPVVEPVTLEEIYTFLRLDPEGSPPTHPDDEMLTSFIKAAREKVEQVTRRTLVESSYKAIYRRFPVHKVHIGGSGFDIDDFEFRYDAIELPRPPVSSVTAVQYYDEDNVLRTFSGANWFLVSDTLTAKIQLVSGQTWPFSFSRDDALQVTFTAGYPPIGSPADDYRSNIPEAIKTALKLEVKLLYDPLSPEQEEAVRKSIDRLLVSYRVYSF